MVGKRMGRPPGTKNKPGMKVGRPSNATRIARSIVSTIDTRATSNIRATPTERAPTNSSADIPLHSFFRDPRLSTCVQPKEITLASDTMRSTLNTTPPPSDDPTAITTSPTASSHTTNVSTSLPAFVSEDEPAYNEKEDVLQRMLDESAALQDGKMRDD